MPTPTYVPLATQTLGSTASSVTFSSIPATFRDLILIALPFASGNTSINLILNSDSNASNYSQVFMTGDSAGPSSGIRSNDFSFTNTTGVQSIWQFLDSSATDKHKTLLVRDGTASIYSAARAGRHANTNAITSIQLTAAAGTFSIGSTFSLYGVN